MELMFLIIKLGYGSVVIPEKYPKEQCEKLAAGYAGVSGYCIPAPILNCKTTVANGDGTYTVMDTYCNLSVKVK